MRIRIHPFLWIYLLCIAFLSSYTNCLCMLLTLSIHEASHYAAARVAGEQLAELEITPLGGILRYKHGFVPNKGIKGVLVHCAGPAGNWAVLLVSSFPAMQQIDPVFMRSLILCNASMLMLNLLPVLPLDGGQIVFCLGYYLFPVSALARSLSLLGRLTGIGGLILSIYGLFCHQLLNCSLLIISLYMISSTRQTQRTLLAQNVYTVVHELMITPQRIRKMIRYQIPADTPLLNLMDLLKENVSVSFVFSMDTQVCELTEHDFCQAVTIMYNPTAAEAYAQLAKGKYKEMKS